jgi:hypothetical protein
MHDHKTHSHHHAHDCPARRRFLALSAAGGLAALLGVPRRAHAIAASQGDVFVNGMPAAADQAVSAGDHVVVSHGSSATLVVGEDAYDLGERTDLRIGRFDRTIELYTGSMLSVFGAGTTHLLTPLASMVIRGSGIFVHAEPEYVYYCTCYGSSRIVTYGGEGSRSTEDVTATHHAPRLIALDGRGKVQILPADVEQHNDEQLTALEARVGRKPPFA